MNGEDHNKRFIPNFPEISVIFLIWILLYVSVSQPVLPGQKVLQKLSSGAPENSQVSWIFFKLFPRTN